MRHLLLLAPLGIFIYHSAAAAAVESTKIPVTPDVALSFSTSTQNGAVSRSAAAAWLAGSHTVVLATADPDHPDTTWIETVEVSTGQRRRLGEGSNPQPSPDGRWIAYMSGRDKERQIWVMSIEGRERRPLTHRPTGMDGWFLNTAWSPDSRRLAYCFAANPFGVKETKDTKEAAGTSVVVYGSGKAAPPPAEVLIIDLATGTERLLTTYAGTLSSLSWFPDGRHLLVYAFRQGSFYHEARDVSEVRVISVANGDARTLVKGGGELMHASASPDGSQVALYYDADDVRYPDMYEVALVAAAGGPLRRLTPKILPGGRAGPLWARDGSGVYYTTKTGAFSQVFFVTTGGVIRQLTSSAVEHRNLAISSDGRLLSWQEQDPQGGRRLVVANPDGRGERTLIDVTPAFGTLALTKAREVRWTSTDGLEVSGILVEPAGYVPGKAFPLVVELHGGPVGGVGVDGEIMCVGPLERQIWAAKGYAVFAPDYRTSGVYGWEHIVAGRARQDFMARDFDDIMSGVDSLVRAGIADPARMVVGGHSYGGLLTNWVITHTGRFKAAVSYEGLADWYVTYGSEYGVGGNTTLAWQFKGKPWEVPENYLRNSPFYQMNGVTTPTLFIVGDGTAYGGSYPAQYEFMYTALKQQGVETGLLLYKREGHIVRSPENVRDLTARVIAWVDDHLRAGGTD